jgi:hypothetical protein
VSHLRVWRARCLAKRDGAASSLGARAAGAIRL